MKDLDATENELMDENEKLKNENEKLEDENEKLEKENGKLEDENINLENENENLIDKNEKLEKENEKLKNYIKEFQEELEALSHEYGVYKGYSEDYLEDLDELKTELLNGVQATEKMRENFHELDELLLETDGRKVSRKELKELYNEAIENFEDDMNTVIAHLTSIEEIADDSIKDGLEANFTECMAKEMDKLTANMERVYYYYGEY